MFHNIIISQDILTGPFLADLGIPASCASLCRIIVAMPHCLNAPRPECRNSSRNAPIAKSQCSNHEVAMPHFLSECPSDFIIKKMLC